MGGAGKAVKSPFAVTAGTSLTVLKPLYSLAIPEVNSNRFEIHFIVEMRCESPSRARVTVKVLAGMPLNRVSFLNE